MVNGSAGKDLHRCSRHCGFHFILYNTRAWYMWWISLFDMHHMYTNRSYLFILVIFNQQRSRCFNCPNLWNLGHLITLFAHSWELKNWQMKIGYRWLSEMADPDYLQIKEKIEFAIQHLAKLQTLIEKAKHLSLTDDERQGLMMKVSSLEEQLRTIDQTLQNHFNNT